MMCGHGVSSPSLTTSLKRLFPGNNLKSWIAHFILFHYFFFGGGVADDLTDLVATPFFGEHFRSVSGLEGNTEQ